MTLERLYYELRLMGKRVILTPVLLATGFALFAAFLATRQIDPARFLSGGLEMLLPLATGMIVATIASHDPALELQLTVPRAYAATAVKRMALVAGWAIAIALLASALLSALRLTYVPQQLNSWPTALAFLTNQLTWLAPLCWMVAIGLCLALLLRSRTASSAIVGGIWILEIIFKDGLAAIPWLHPVLLFPTTLILFPSPFISNDVFWTWLTSRCEILGTGLLLLVLAWLLLRNPEGLLKGASEE
ncbi:MAG TPA: hypothetical protein VGT44_19450 [Ktedonobacteraceae bacterium]|nr:hypothetical protein [Ktedonobacteraceae bacterium]